VFFQQARGVLAFALLGGGLTCLLGAARTNQTFASLPQNKSGQNFNLACSFSLPRKCKIFSKHFSSIESIHNHIGSITLNQYYMT
jgi:hypothetical protein